MTTPNSANAPRARRALRAATVGALAAVPLLLASPAFASVPAAPGYDRGPEMSPAAFILVLGGTPLAVFTIIALLVSIPGMARGNRYRPHTLSWWASPVWFGGPADEAGQPGDRALTGTSLAALPAVIASDDQTEGGASARW